MKKQTVLKQGHRVYMIVTSTGKQAFCNITELNKTVEGLETHEGYFKIYHFWNNKQTYLSRKKLLVMFEGSQLKQEFYY